MIIGFARKIPKIPPFGTMKSENLKDLEAFTFSYPKSTMFESTRYSIREI